MKLKELKNKSKDYDASAKGQNMNKILKRIYTTSIICIIYGILAITYNIIAKLKWYEYILPISCLIFAFIFINKAINIKEVEVNIYNYKEKHKKKN